MWLKLTDELDIKNEEKDSKKVFFNLNKWVEDETIFITAPAASKPFPLLPTESN